MSYKIAIFSLNQWALDFEGNTRRIIKSIENANKAGAVYRAGPELELCGYSLEDAFFEQDTLQHCWSCLKDIMSFSCNIDLIIDIGMPIHFGSLYNCRVLLYKGQVLCIRAKSSLAIDGNYREPRHFKKWPKKSGLVPFKLPSILSSDKNFNTYVPFGADYILELEVPGRGIMRIGWEICQELWEVKNVSSRLYKDFGCHLVVNGSCSYWELRKLDIVADILKGISLRGGACYAFSNLIGCDGQRCVYYGRSCIFDRGNLVAMTPTESSQMLDEIQMITYDIDPRDLDECRAQSGIRPDLSARRRVWNLADPPQDNSQIDTSYNILYLSIEQNRQNISSAITFNHIPNTKIRFEQEIFHYVSLWLWDYLRRSRMIGFMMPLSGGLDSSTVAVLIYSLCSLLHRSLDKQTVTEYFDECHNIKPGLIKKTFNSPADICKRIFKCRYISTEFSSQTTENRAALLSKAIRADYSSVSIQEIYTKCRDIESTGKLKNEVSLLDQNIQARLRMTTTYYLSGGNRIVLATGNVDEAIMGYLTKYDCSSADINPIGGLCKNDLKSYLSYCCTNLFSNELELVEAIRNVMDAPPSAELTGSEQRDEDEIGITYDEISVLGKVRRGIYGCSGPTGAFKKVWSNRNNPLFNSKIRCLKRHQAYREPGVIAQDIANLIMRFYTRYTKNRHKLTVLTPALHAESYSPDDNRFDHRQFLYPPLKYQFNLIETMVEEIKKNGDLAK